MKKLTTLALLSLAFLNTAPTLAADDSYEKMMACQSRADAARTEYDSPELSKLRDHLGLAGKEISEATDRATQAINDFLFAFTQVDFGQIAAARGPDGDYEVHRKARLVVSRMKGVIDDVNHGTNKKVFGEVGYEGHESLVCESDSLQIKRVSISSSNDRYPLDELRCGDQPTGVLSNRGLVLNLSSPDSDGDRWPLSVRAYFNQPNGGWGVVEHSLVGLEKGEVKTLDLATVRQMRLKAYLDRLLPAKYPGDVELKDLQASYSLKDGRLEITSRDAWVEMRLAQADCDKGYAKSKIGQGKGPQAKTVVAQKTKPSVGFTPAWRIEGGILVKAVQPVPVK